MRVSGGFPRKTDWEHNINLSETEDLVTVMWANETFDNKRLDTCFESVGGPEA